MRKLSNAIDGYIMPNEISDSEWNEIHALCFRLQHGVNFSTAETIAAFNVIKNIESLYQVERKHRFDKQKIANELENLCNIHSAAANLFESNPVAAEILKTAQVKWYEIACQLEKDAEYDDDAPF